MKDRNLNNTLDNMVNFIMGEFTAGQTITANGDNNTSENTQSHGQSSSSLSQKQLSLTANFKRRHVHYVVLEILIVNQVMIVVMLCL